MSEVVMEDEVEYTKEEQRYLDDKIRKAKKEIQRQRDLADLVVGSAWMTIPVYSEVVDINLDNQELVVRDEWDVTYTTSVDDFLVRNNYYG